MDDSLAELTAAVLKSAKYKHIYPGLVERIGAEELAKGRKLKEAIKQTKNKLHQVGGAYFSKPIDYPKILNQLRGAAEETAALKAVCLDAMDSDARAVEWRMDQLLS